MIFLLIVLLYLLIGALLVITSLCRAESQKSFRKNVNDLASESGISRKAAMVIMICVAVLLWPLVVKSIYFKNRKE